jgi:hypothetical protein
MYKHYIERLHRDEARAAANRMLDRALRQSKRSWLMRLLFG